MAIRSWPLGERPREKLLARGAGSLSDAELLAIFLRTGVAGSSALDLSRQLLDKFGGLRPILDADPLSLCAVPGIGPAKSVLLASALELGRRYLQSNLQRGQVLGNPQQTRDFLKSALRRYPYEVFACLFLDVRHRVIAFEEMFRGTIDGASVYPREVVRRALTLNAGAIILAHNHPSGVAEPSQADRVLTRRLTDALALVDVKVLDHFIVGDSEIMSFAEQGCL